MTNLKEQYKVLTKDEILSLSIHKWMGRGFLAWILTLIIFRPSPIEFVIVLFPLFTFIIWMIRIEWKQYKWWLKQKGNKK